MGEQEWMKVWCEVSTNMQGSQMMNENQRAADEGGGPYKWTVLKTNEINSVHFELNHSWTSHVQVSGQR